MIGVAQSVAPERHTLRSGIHFPVREALWAYSEKGTPAFIIDEASSTALSGDLDLLRSTRLVKLMHLALCTGALCSATAGVAQYAPAVPVTNGLLGYWSTDGRAVLHIDDCGADVCITVVTISQKAPGVIDGRNPDLSLRTRPVCRMNIGSGFELKDDDHAEKGRIYDPEAGKTYKASMSSDGNTLHLRGYIGFKALGQTQSWHRTSADSATCVGITHR